MADLIQKMIDETCKAYKMKPREMLRALMAALYDSHRDIRMDHGEDTSTALEMAEDEVNEQRSRNQAFVEEHGEDDSLAASLAEADTAAGEQSAALDLLIQVRKLVEKTVKQDRQKLPSGVVMTIHYGPAHSELLN